MDDDDEPASDFALPTLSAAQRCETMEFASLTLQDTTVVF